MTEPAPSSTQPMPPSDLARAGSPLEVAAVFLRLGATAFGGPAAHIAMMEDELVRRRAWVSRQEFLDLLAATNLIPGPNSTEMAIHLGYRRAGWAGLLAGGCAFILPAFAIVMIIAWAYTTGGHTPAAEGLLYGIKPVVLAIIAQAIWRLSEPVSRSPLMAALGLACTVAAALGAPELAVLFGAGLLAPLLRAASRRPSPTARCILPPGTGVLALLGLSATPAAPAAATPWALFWVFAKIGSVLWGSGYVLAAFLQSELVDTRAWLTSQQVLDAIAIGQFTPGPVFTTATFIGYLLAGPSGGIAATIGIFAPAFLFVAITAPIVPRLRSWALGAAILDGLTAASLALMLDVTVRLGFAAIIDAPTAALAALAALLLIRFNIGSGKLILLGGLAGLAITWLA